MFSPSPAQFNSDAEPTGLLKSHANDSGSPASDHIILNRVQFERELAHEVLHQDLAATEQDDHLRGQTISYEEALERELEYQKRMKKILSQPSVGSGVLPSPSQEPSLVGVKRKAVCGEFAEPAPRGSHDPSPLPEQLQDWQAAPQLRIFRQPQLQERQPLPQQSQHHPMGSTSKQTLVQGLKHRQSLLPQSHYQKHVQRQSQGQQPPKQQLCNQQQPNYQDTPLWCYVCKVKCVTPHNLKSHYQGRKHIAKLDEIFGNNMSTTVSDVDGGAKQAMKARHEHEVVAGAGGDRFSEQSDANSRHKQEELVTHLWKILDHVE